MKQSEMFANEVENARIAGLRPTRDPVIDEDTYFNVKGDPMAAKFVAGLKAKDDDRRRRLASPGALGLSSLLDKRRLEFLIPNEAFREQPLYDRIFVWRISFHGEQETYGDTKIVMTKSTQDAEKHSSTSGVLLAAGPIALDELRSNGVELGHIVSFIKLAPWSKQIAVKGGHDEHVLVLRSCDLLSSEDLATDMRAGEVKIEEFPVEKDGRTFFTHVIKDARRPEPWHPQQPCIPEDY